MDGSITKYAVKGSSKPRWRYRIYLGKDERGRKLYDGRGGFEKQGDAADDMRRRWHELRAERGKAPAQEKTLGEWIRTWLDTYAVDRCQPKTLERYHQLAEYVTAAPEGMLATLAQIPLPELKHTHLEPALFSLLKAKGKRREHISSRTVRHVAGLLNVALNKAFRLDMIPVNPMLRVELPSAPQKEARSLTPEELQSLRLACRGDWTFGLIELAMATGARRGELLALQWSDLDLLRRTITISKSLEQTRAGLRIKAPKGKKTRSFILPQTAVAALQFLREEQKEHRRLFAGSYQEHDLVFCQPEGSYREPDLVSQVVIRRMRKAGIKQASIHTLRHTHTSHLLSNGVPLPAVSARLGHADTNVTARIYSHALPADDQRAADVWDSLIDERIQ
jgi:integrase